MCPLLEESTLARTYAPPSVADPYDAVQQYRAAVQYGPDAGSTTVARALGVPRGRVRPWLNGAKPDAVRAIETAAARGWLSTDWTPQIEALAVLCIGVYACGSIAQQDYRPIWTPATPAGRQQLETALSDVGVGRRVEAGDRTLELRPATAASLLGRCLASAGTPIGVKTPATVPGLPEWLTTAPRTVRVAVAELLTQEHPDENHNRNNYRGRRARAPAYFDDVAAFLAEVRNEENEATTPQRTSRIGD